MKSMILIVAAIFGLSSLDASKDKFDGARSKRIFILVVESMPFIPSSWDEVFLSDEQLSAMCPGRGSLCAIQIPLTDVYSSPVNKPKVDIQTTATGELQDDMLASLLAPQEAQEIHGRRIFEHEIEE